MTTGFTRALLLCAVLLSFVSRISADCPGVTNLPVQCKCELIQGDDAEVTCYNVNGSNPLTEFPLELPKTIIHLEIYGQNIAMIDKVPYPHLTSLRLANNQIKTILPDAFKGLNKLRHLILSNNYLDTLYSDLFADLASLEFLKLDSNRISMFWENTFNGDHLKQLFKIDVANNSITEVEHVFQNLHLAELNISQNNLVAIPKVNSTRVESLILDHNKIEKILDDDMKSYPYLLTLSLHHNLLNNIFSAAFRHNLQLEELNLENNNISQIQLGTFANQSFIKSIRLSWNNLEFLDRDVIPWNSKLQDLRLYGNPWRCVCAMSWLYNASRSSPVFMSNYGSQHYRCASPQELKERPIYQVMASDLRCNDEEGHVRLVMIIGLVSAVTLILLIGWLIYTVRRRRLLSQYYRHSASSVYKKVTEPTFVVESSTVAFHDDDSKQLVYSDRKNRVVV